MVGSDVVDMF